MKYVMIAAVLASSMVCIGQADAKGCIKGALAGGVAGHFAGHHGLMGAAAGCAIGHHYANKKNTAAPNDPDNGNGQQQAPVTQ